MSASSRADPEALLHASCSRGERSIPPRLRSIAELPRPRGLPLLGNLLQLDVITMHQRFEAWSRDLGSFYAFYVLGTPVVVVSDPALAQAVLRARPETYRRATRLSSAFEELGLDSVFSAEGSSWHEQRRLAMDALSNRNLRGFYPTLHRVAERLRRRWERAAERGSAVDITEDLRFFTIDVTTALAFGVDLNTLEDAGNQKIRRQLDTIFPTLQRRLIAAVPTWRYFKLPSDRRADRALADLRIWLSELVRDARVALSRAPERAEAPSNFLEAMVATRDSSGRPLSDELIFGNLLVMLLAGEETTAHTLAWAVHLLCDSPSSAASLVSEVDASSTATSVPPTIEAANALVYTASVANEAMRLRPSAPVIAFESVISTVLGDVLLPAGTQGVVLVRPPGAREENFHAAESFKPARWLGGDEEGAHSPSVHIPFGSGPRICAGRSLALLEMKVALATLYGHFDVSRVGTSRDVSERLEVTMAPVGLRVRLRRRRA